MNTHHDFLKTLFSGLLVLPMTLMAQASAFGADGDTADTIDKEIEISGLILDGDSYRFGKYTGVTEEEFTPVFDFKLQSKPAWDSSDTTSWKLQGWRIGLDSLRLEFDYHDQGTQRFKAGFRKIPNYRFSDGMTPFNGVGTDVLTLPDNWVGPRNGTTDSFATLDENLGPVHNKWDRRRLDFGFDRKISEQWSFSVDWRHEVKEGLRSFGGVIGNSGGNPRAVVLPAPIDWETDIMEAAFNFGNSRFQFGVGLYGSWFDNSTTSASWENPYGQRSGWAPGVGFPNGEGLYSLEPNNEAMQLRVYGGINLSPASRLSADVSMGTMKQNDTLFDYSINQALRIDVPLPRALMDAEIETTHANIRYTVRPLNNVSLLANYTKDERDNKTPRDVWVYIGGDSQNQKDPEDGRINLPYSYEKDKFDLTATWRAAKGVRVKGGFESMDYNRTYSEVLDSDETRWFAGIKLNRWEKASLSFDFSSSERDVDDYQGNRTLILSHLPGEIDDDDFENLPGMRKYNQADREREEYRVRADFFPTPKFNFAFSGSVAEDEYHEDIELFGLQESEVSSWTVDFGLYPSNGVSLTAYYTTETYDTEQSSRTWAIASQAADPNRNWYVDSEDEVDTANVALTFSDIGGEPGGAGTLDFGFDYTLSKVESDIMVSGGSSVTTEPLPLLVSEMTSWSMFATVYINPRSSIRMSYEQQELKTDDFALDGIPVDGPSNVLLLAESSANYDLTLFMLTYSYRY